jgi:putative molybdopterin biosynthesis protein
MIRDEIMNEEHNDFMTLNEVAVALRVSKITVWRYIKNSKLPAYKFGRDLRIDKTDFRHFVKSKRLARDDT